VRIQVFHPNPRLLRCFHINRRRLVSFGIAIFLLVSLFGVDLTFVTKDKTAAAADNLFYDFVSHAPNALWSSGVGSLSFPGIDTDSQGFAIYRDNWQLEDNSTKSRVLETHPQWVSGGWIIGKYPQVTIPSGAELSVKLGFLKGSTGTDGVIFKVQFEEFLGLKIAPKIYTMLSHVATYDGKLDSITEDLGFLEGKTGSFILYVNAGQNSGQDWAVWADAEILMTEIRLPDLLTTEVWEEEGEIWYKIVNEGEGSVFSPESQTTHFCNALSVDGELVAEDCVNIYEMLPGQKIENPFDYSWAPTPGGHEIEVCADLDNEVAESNESNNCLDEIFEGEITFIQPTPIFEACLYSISGTIHNFHYQADTLKIKVCEAETIVLHTDGRTHPITECVEGGMVRYIDVSRRMEGDLPGPDLDYRVGGLCPGVYILVPLYNPAADVCQWQGTWRTAKGQIVRIENSNAEGFDFTFTPLDSTTPTVSLIQVEPEQPEYGEEVMVTVLANDNGEIVGMWQKTDVLGLDGTVYNDYWHSLIIEPGLEGNTAGARFSFIVHNVMTATVTVKVCDDGGNSRTSRKVITCGSCNDGIQNQGETGIDCGGPCPSKCVECLSDHSLGTAPSAYLYSPDDRSTVHRAAIESLFEYADEIGVSVLDLDTGDTYSTADNFIRAVAWWIPRHMGYRGDDDNRLCLDSVLTPPYDPSTYGHFDYPVPANYTLRYSGDAYVTDTTKDYFGDCEDFAILASAMLRSLGVCYNCIFNAEQPGHGFNIIYYEGKYRVMEPQANCLKCEGYGPEFIWNDRVGAFSCSSFDNNKMRPWKYTMNYPYCQHPDVNVIGGGFSPKELWLDWANWDEDSTIAVGDFDNDGIDDIAAVWNEEITRKFIATVLSSNGSRFEVPSVTREMSGATTAEAMVGHLPTGDFIVITKHSFPGGFRCVEGTATSCPHWADGYTVSSDDNVICFGDPYGNGTVNVMTFSQGDSAEVRVNGRVWAEGFSSDVEIPMVGDFDGDGCDDAISFERRYGGVRVIRSIPGGNDFTMFYLWYDRFCVGNEIPMIGDFNGDGRDDIISFSLNDGRVYVGLSTVFGFWSGGLAGTRTIWRTEFCHNGEEPFVGDFNGDGLDDIAYFRLDGDRARVWVSLANPTTITYNFHGGCLCEQANFYQDGYWPSICP
jgi:hypothetical protein